MDMKQFAGHKNVATIAKQCKAQGLQLNDRLYKTGWDTVVVSGGGAHVTYNSFNGRFFGVTPDGTRFSSDETVHEHEPWFQSVLLFFYIERSPQLEAVLRSATEAAS